MNSSVTSRDPYVVWESAIQGPIVIGSEDHKQLFCRMFLDTFDLYKPAVIEWPKLNDEALANVPPS